MLHCVFDHSQALLAKAREVDASIVYLSNPNNPMGSINPAGVVQSLIDSLPSGCLLCLDEAYIEFAPAGVAPPIDPNDPKVIR